MNKLLGENRKGNALLCRFFGETDRPIVTIAKTTEQVREAIADFWTGDRTSEETMAAMRRIETNNFAIVVTVLFEFEIGGAEFSDVFHE